MHWNFASRAGDLEIKNFDNRSYGTGTNGLTQPNLDLNKFGGSLTQTGGDTIGTVTGHATGSFVNSPVKPAAGVIGNWNVDSSAYKATGIFGGAR